MAFRTAMPDSAIMPIMAVAVKKTGFGWPATAPPVNAFRSQNPGMMPIRVSGIEIIRISGIA